jgi:cytoskeletal protein CcmA (bactofilin family)
VSRGVIIKGEISGQGDFFLDGTFEGKVHLPDGSFTAGPNAHVTAEIEAREIIVLGEVIGTLRARERVHISSTGRLTGDMDTRGIVIEDGAVLHSKVATPRAVASPSATSEVAITQAAAAKQTIPATVAEPEAAVTNASAENVLPEKAQPSEPSPSREIAPRAKSASAASGDS